ncbi:MAG: cobyric acid synthase CobQ, partial [Vulcanococcus sp.]
PALWPDAAEAALLEGFELHRGATSALEPCQALAEDPSLGWVAGSTAATYLHGVFESGPWRRRWLNQLRARKGLPLLSERQPHHSRQREALLDRLADAFEQHVNLEPLLKP